ncbi:DMT family transporter [Sulfurimonas paralvinellae]|uniref:DMT family transporter n=1 Tax=Sulfurimonas paralvinellae TaxID=317658 RepID=A0A7M1BD01_9BACT|nr:DMT family transporter [Sulfurimonas paralvinellae]QOP46672.1 DMT family transporter [Sulfurimonas paralvinellae]
MQERHFSYLMLLAMFFWGGGWTALKILTYNLPMDVIIFWRFFLMSLAFIPIIIYFKIPFKLDLHSLKYILGSSVLNVSFMISSFYGVKYGYAGGGSVIITTFSPIMTFLLVAVLFRNRLETRQYFGLLLGLIGGYILLQLNDFSLFLNSSNLYFLLCALIWAGVTVLSQHSQKHIHPIHYSFAISLIATLFTFLYAKDSDLGAVFHQGAAFWTAMIYLAVFGQTIATTIFFISSGRLGSEKTSSYMFLVPLFALFSAWLILDEPMQPHIIIGGAISMLAVYFINKK